MARDFEVGQKAYLCFNEPEEVIVVKTPFYSSKSHDLRMELKDKEGGIIDPVPSLVYHTKAQYYEEQIIKLTKKLNETKDKLKQEMKK